MCVCDLQLGHSLGRHVDVGVGTSLQLAACGLACERAHGARRSLRLWCAGAEEARRRSAAIGSGSGALALAQVLARLSAIGFWLWLDFVCIALWHVIVRAFRASASAPSALLHLTLTQASLALRALLVELFSLAVKRS
jgi:hypothetical protein